MVERDGLTLVGREILLVGRIVLKDNEFVRHDIAFRTDIVLGALGNDGLEGVDIPLLTAVVDHFFFDNGLAEESVDAVSDVSGVITVGVVEDSHLLLERGTVVGFHRGLSTPEVDQRILVRGKPSGEFAIFKHLGDQDRLGGRQCLMIREGGITLYRSMYGGVD